MSLSLDLLGDRWSLLIVRDLMVRGYRTFREFQRSGEGIASNILAERLHRLEAGGIVLREPANDGRSTHYRLTEKGIALAPVLLELLIWGGRHEDSDAPCAAIEHMANNRAAVLAEAYRRWNERDPTPLLPPFRSQSEPAAAQASASTNQNPNHSRRQIHTVNSRSSKNSPKGHAKR